MLKQFWMLIWFLIFVTNINSQIISVNQWNDLFSNGWGVDQNENVSITHDLNSLNPPTVLKIRFPTGYSDGGEPSFAYYRDVNVKEVYIGFWLKLEEYYYQHQVVQKISYIHVDDCDDNVYVGIKSDGSFIFTPQPTWTNHANLYPNLGNEGKVKPGNWQWIEIHYKMNTPGNKDGVAELWINGTKTHSYHNVAIANSGMNDPQFSRVLLRPIFGGYDGTVNPREWNMYFDYTVISTVPIGLPGDINNKPLPSSGLSIQK